MAVQVEDCALLEERELEQGREHAESTGQSELGSLGDMFADDYNDDNNSSGDSDYAEGSMGPSDALLQLAVCRQR